MQIGSQEAESTQYEVAENRKRVEGWLRGLDEGEPRYMEALTAILFDKEEG